MESLTAADLVQVNLLSAGPVYVEKWITADER
jgi:hypothetical protein